MSLAMSWDEWSAMDAVGLAALVAAGEVSAQELAGQAASGIERTNPAIDGVVEVFDDAVADPAAAGMDLDGALSGVPFFLKDLGPTLKGRLQEMGSMLMRGNRAGEDAFLVQRMRAAGLNIIARTTTPEFGCCSAAENPALHTTRNPWNTAFTSFGSSAGSAVMVAAGVVPMAHGTDGGGSIRIPAGTTGSIGLKSSRGVFSIAPAGSDFTSAVSTQGCISRSVRDTAAFVDHCRGGAPGEYMPYWTPTEPYSEAIRRDPKPLRIALSHEWGPYRATPAIVQELEKAGRFFERLGHHVEARVPDADLHAAYAAQTTCYITNFAQVINGLIARLGLDRPPEHLVEPMNIRIWERGRDATYEERARMQQAFNTTSRAFGAFLSEWDVILTPTMAKETPPVGTRDYLTLSDNPSVHDWFDNLWRIFAYTPLGNLCGIPGISMPLGWLDNGLPVGIQAQTRQGNDVLLLQLAAQAERALGGNWHGARRPQVHVATLPEG